MKRTVFFSLAALLLTLFPCCAPLPPAEKAARLEEQGRFREAAAILTEAIDGATEDERATLEFELDRLRRIRLDYSLTRPMMFKALQRGLTTFAPEEFDRWIVEGRFDTRTIDDTLYFADVSYRNLFWRYPELDPRRVPRRDKSAVEHHMLAVARAIKAASAAAGTPYVLPTRLSVTMIVSADPNAAPAGETVRAWLPFPRLYPFQRDIVFLASSVPVLNLAEESSPLRSAYLEQTAVQDSPTVFRIDYESGSARLWQHSGVSSGESG